jgi:hypothetical protein
MADTATNAMKARVGGLYLKLNEAIKSRSAPSPDAVDTSVAGVGPLVLATTIASRTVNALVEGEMLDPRIAPELLRVYESSLGQDRTIGQCILQFLFSDEGKLAMAMRWLNTQAQLHVWEMAHRISPPRAFYRAHPELAEACKVCGAVVLDAATPATLTTGSINPLIGDFLGRWVQSVLRNDPSESRPRFHFHVVVPPRYWSTIVRTHFNLDHGI